MQVTNIYVLQGVMATRVFTLKRGCPRSALRTQSLSVKGARRGKDVAHIRDRPHGATNADSPILWDTSYLAQYGPPIVSYEAVMDKTTDAGMKEWLTAIV